jgi:hypothetical protein
MLTLELATAVSSGAMGVRAALNRASGRVVEKPRDRAGKGMNRATSRAGRKTGNRRGRPRNGEGVYDIGQDWLVLLVEEWATLRASGADLTPDQAARFEELSEELSADRPRRCWPDVARSVVKREVVRGDAADAVRERMATRHARQNRLWDSEHSSIADPLPIDRAPETTGMSFFVAPPHTMPVVAPRSEGEITPQHGPAPSARYWGGLPVSFGVVDTYLHREDAPLLALLKCGAIAEESAVRLSADYAAECAQHAADSHTPNQFHRVELPAPRACVKRDSLNTPRDPRPLPSIVHCVGTYSREVYLAECDPDESARLVTDWERVRFPYLLALDTDDPLESANVVLREWHPAS